jgi:hypothetical protein
LTPRRKFKYVNIYVHQAAIPYHWHEHCHHLVPKNIIKTRRATSRESFNKLLEHRQNSSFCGTQQHCTPFSAAKVIFGGQDLAAENKPIFGVF